MFAKLKREWRQLKAGKPGHRFQAQYKAQQSSRRPAWVRPIWIAAGTALMALGVVALPAPGPGFLIIGLGGAMVARESRAAARILDWIELRLREAWAWAKDAWSEAPLPVKILAVTFGAALAVAIGWLGAIYIRSR